MAYDPRAVKVSKSVKRVAATITDPTRRRDFIRGYVQAEAANARAGANRRRDKNE
jgi:ribosomal protein L4